MSLNGAILFVETALRLSNISKKKRMELAKQVDENKIDDLRRQISESEVNFETVLEAVRNGGGRTAVPVTK